MRVLVTRPQPAADRTAAVLKARGHQPILCPVLYLADLPAEIDPACFAAIAVTSANAVDALSRHPSFAALTGLPLFAVGDKSAQRALAAGFQTVRSAGGAVDDLCRLIAASRNAAAGAVLYAAARDRAGDLEGCLRGKGFSVTTIDVYHAGPVSDLPDALDRACATGPPDRIAVYSARSATHLAAAANQSSCGETLRKATVVAISKAAAAPLRRSGWKACRIAHRPTEAALLDLLDAGE